MFKHLRRKRCKRQHIRKELKQLAKYYVDRVEGMGLPRYARHFSGDKLVAHVTGDTEE